MKKIFIFFVMLFSFIQVFTAVAYQLNKDSLIFVGGQSIGIKLNTGVSVVGSYGIYVDGKLSKPWEQAGITEGDRITSLNNNQISDIKSLLKALKGTNGKSVAISYVRSNTEHTATIKPVYVDDSYSLGLYVKDCIMGVGTLTYYVEEVKTYGSLGHQITQDSFYSGEIYEAKVTEIVKPTRGEAGEKRASIDSGVIGNVEKNTSTGVQGIANSSFDTSKMTLLGFKTKEEVKTGAAEIWTCISGTEIEKFTINITKLENQTSNSIKGISFEVTDADLISKTGGIIQGMSGSPIVQDNKIIGAVTHVLLNNSKKGYGIYLEFMLEDMGIYINK